MQNFKRQQLSHPEKSNRLYQTSEFHASSTLPMSSPGMLVLGGRDEFLQELTLGLPHSCRVKRILGGRKPCGAGLCYTLLSSATLCSALLHPVQLCYTLLSFATLCSAVLKSAPLCLALVCTAPHFQFSSVLLCSVLSSSVLLNSALFCCNLPRAVLLSSIQPLTNMEKFP